MSGDGRQERGGGAGSDGDDLEARLRRLEAGLKQKRPSPAAGEGGAGSASSGSSSLGRAFRLSTEFVAGIIAGGLLGWGFDFVVGSRPWGMIGFLLLGFAAGIYNVMRASGFLTPPSGPSTR